MSKKDGKRRKKHAGSGEESGGGGGGLLTSMRGGFKSLAGASEKKGPRTTWDKAKDILFWVALIALLGFAFYRLAAPR